MADIYNTDSGVTLTEGADADSITNSATNVLIDTGDGNDTITNDYGYGVTISGGDGAD